MSIVEFDGSPSWSLNASETGASIKCPCVGVVEGMAGVIFFSDSSELSVSRLLMRWSLVIYREYYTGKYHRALQYYKPTIECQPTFNCSKIARATQ